MRASARTWLFAAVAIYWALRFEDSRRWVRLGIAVAAGMFALLSAWLDEVNEQKRERFLRDD